MKIHQATPEELSHKPWQPCIPHLLTHALIHTLLLNQNPIKFIENSSVLKLLRNVWLDTPPNMIKNLNKPFAPPHCDLYHSRANNLPDKRNKRTLRNPRTNNNKLKRDKTIIIISHNHHINQQPLMCCGFCFSIFF